MSFSQGDGHLKLFSGLLSMCPIIIVEEVLIIGRFAISLLVLVRACMHVCTCACVFVCMCMYVCVPLLKL